MSPSSTARTAAWVRSETPSLSMMRSTCTLTVPTLTNRLWPISAFVLPSATSRSTSSSRGVRSSPRAAGRSLARGCPPVDVRHADVHQDHVWLELARQLDGLPAGGSLADHLQVRFWTEHGTQAQPSKLVIVGDDYAPWCLFVPYTVFG